MPILHDNRNMRPDLLGKPTEDIDDIFASADAQMEQQRQKQLFQPSKKRINWKKKIKQSMTMSIILIILILIGVGLIIAQHSYTTVVNELQSQVLIEVSKIKTNINAKDESELTEEDRLMLSIFEVLSDEDIARIVKSATSVEEIIYIIKNETLDINRYLTPDQQKQLETLLLEYAEDLEARAEQLEQEAADETESIIETECPTEPEPIIDTDNNS